MKVVTKLALNGEVVNLGGSGLSAGDAYSTEEQRIGTWIDGKPLYRRTFVLASGSSNGTVNSLIDVHAYNMDEVIKIEGFLLVSDETRLPFNYSVSAQDYLAVYYRWTGYISEKHAPADKSNLPMYLTVTYTKTTDEASITLATDVNAVQTQTEDLHSNYDEEVNG